jgi:hypothetical protein
MADQPKLLSGGNPQIPMGDGDAPIRAYIAALPGWKADAMRKLDALIVATLPDVRKAVKWNSPFYGAPSMGWLLAVHAYAGYLKLNFFKGRLLDPMPPVASKDAAARYLHIGEDGIGDEAQLAEWLRQAAAIPGYLTPKV